jgi:hypothetical protein
LKCSCFFYRYVSWLNKSCKDLIPKCLPLSKRATSYFILEAATIFMALVIFLMDPTDFILCLSYFRFSVANAN